MENKEPHKNENTDAADNNENENVVLYEIDIAPSPSKLVAYLRIRTADDDVEIPIDVVLKKLKQQNIVFGFDIGAIREYLEKKDFFKELKIAEGKPPVNGHDAEIKYNFDLNDEVEFKEREDGSIDFKNLDNIKSVEKGGILCTLIPATVGEDGKDIYGQLIQANPGKELSLSVGRNTSLSEDELKLISDVDGCITVANNTINIESIYKVGNVDAISGNIDFVGSVIISGDVKAGFKVKAKGDVTVTGMVEASSIIAGGDILISNGMNGGGAGTLSAGGNITSKYLENAKVVAGKSVYADAIVNSNIEAGKAVIAKGSKASIIGGKIKACERIEAKYIGSKNNIQTNIEINIEAFMDKNRLSAKNKAILDRAKHQIDEKLKLMDVYDEKIKYIAPYAKLSPENAKLYKLLILNKSKLRKEINDIKTFIVEQNGSKKAGKISMYKVVCSGIIYANTRVVIGWLRTNIKNDISYSKVYNDGGEIQIVQLVSSDLAEEN